MSKTKVFYLLMMITEVLLFALGCFSLIFCFAGQETSGNQNALSEVYLIAHLVIIAGVFYYTLRAFQKGPYILKVFMIDDHNNPIIKSRVVSIVIMAITYAIGVYFALLAFGLELPLNFFTLALRHAVMNFGFSVGTIALYFLIFPGIYLKEEQQ